MGLSPNAVENFLEQFGELRNGVCFNKKTNKKINKKSKSVPEQPKAEKPKAEKQNQFDPKSVELPANVNRDLWIQFVDMRNSIKKPLTEKEEYRWGKIYTLFWGIFCMVIAFFAYNLGNSLIEAVNILGSWFYGTILGIFLVAFWLKRVGGNAVFIAAIISEVIVISVYYMDIISFLWLNVIGAVAVIVLSLLIQPFTARKEA